MRENLKIIIKKIIHVKTYLNMQLRLDLKTRRKPQFPSKIPQLDLQKPSNCNYKFIYGYDKPWRDNLKSNIKLLTTTLCMVLSRLLDLCLMLEPNSPFLVIILSFPILI